MGNHLKNGTGHAAAAIAGTFIGTVVGAGFASGQETLQFFTAFGRPGFAGLLLATTLFILFGARMLYVGRRLGATSHGPLVRHALGPRLAPVADVLLTVFLLATAGAMAAGASATLAEQYGMSRWLGSGLMATVSVATVLTGINGVVTAIAFVAPVLIAAILGISLYSLSVDGGLTAAWAWHGMPQLAPVGAWWAAAGLYVAYNMLLAAPVLGPLGTTAANRRALQGGGVLGGIGLGVGAMAIHFAIAARMPDAAGFDVPMLYTAGALPGWVPVAYSALLLSEVYTTAVAMLFGVASRVDETGGDRFRWATLFGGFVAFLGGQFPFARVVGTLYPVMGFVGVVILLGLLRPVPARFHPDT